MTTDLKGFFKSMSLFSYRSKFSGSSSITVFTITHNNKTLSNNFFVSSSLRLFDAACISKTKGIIKSMSMVVPSSVWEKKSCSVFVSLFKHHIVFFTAIHKYPFLILFFSKFILPEASGEIQFLAFSLPLNFWKSIKWHKTNHRIWIRTLHWIKRLQTSGYWS